MKNMIKPIRIVEVKSEIGAGTRGSSMGIDAIKIAALDFGSPFFKKFKSTEIPTENHLLLEPVVHDYAKRIKGIYSLNERIAREIQKTLKREEIPIVLAGDHSSAPWNHKWDKNGLPRKAPRSDLDRCSCRLA